MKKFIVLSGISGVGKTTRYKNDPKLNVYPLVDIADVYGDYPNCTADEALTIFLNNALREVEDHDTVVLEAWFKPGSKQRLYLEHYARGMEIELEYIELDASVSECIERVKKQYAEDMAKGKNLDRLSQYHEARLRLLNLQRN